MSTVPMSELYRCFQGVIPASVVTSDRSGIPNVTYVSQVFKVDDSHVALSCQFFNKTRRNLDENPLVAAEVFDALTLQAYRLHLKFLRSEKSGPLFDTMAMRIQAIASVTGMAGVFRLIAADVFQVLRVEKVDGFLTETPKSVQEGVSVDGLRTELRGLHWISDQINRAEDLETLLDAVLGVLDAYFHFTHTMVLLLDDQCERLITIASRGYGESGVGAEVAIGEGLIGTVAKEKRVLRMTGLEASIRYGRAVRREAIAKNADRSIAPEIPLPGLPDAQSTLIIPLCVGDRLVGVLAAESRDPLGFGEWHEAYLEIIGNQIALGIDRIDERDDEEEEERPRPAIAAKDEPRLPIAAAGERRTFTYYRNDDCIFVDGEYLVRNVPGKILWRLLTDYRETGRTEFTNRELRLDESLGLPPIKDNLESRLILLRTRLQEKCPEIAMVPVARGRFALKVDRTVELVEK